MSGEQYTSSACLAARAAWLSIRVHRPAPAFTRTAKAAVQSAFTTRHRSTSMRQTLLMFVIAIGSPLAMAQDAGGAANASAAGTGATQHPAAAAASEDRGKPAHKPTSAIGRALAGLLQANPPPAKAPQPHAGIHDTADAGTPPDIEAPKRTELAARTEPASPP
jgi:hypothetical protein